MSRSYSKVHGSITQPYRDSHRQKRIRIKKYRNALNNNPDINIKFYHLNYNANEYFKYRWFRFKKYYLHNGRINK